MTHMGICPLAERVFSRGHAGPLGLVCFILVVDQYSLRPPNAGSLFLFSSMVTHVKDILINPSPHKSPLGYLTASRLLKVNTLRDVYTCPCFVGLLLVWVGLAKLCVADTWCSACIVPSSVWNQIAHVHFATPRNTEAKQREDHLRGHLEKMQQELAPNNLAVGQHQWYHFAVGAPPILV